MDKKVYAFLIAASLLTVIAPPAVAQNLDLFRGDLPEAPPTFSLKPDEDRFEPATAPVERGAPAASDCARYPGGNAPIEKIANLSNALSVRNLSFTALRKPLAELTEEDFDDMIWIAIECGYVDRFDSLFLDDFRDKVMEAQEARAEGISWVSETLQEIAALKSGRQALLYLNEAWAEMLSKEQTMMRSDLQVVASAIVLKQDEIYRAQTVAAPPARANALSEQGNGSGLPIGNRVLPHSPSVE